MESKTTAKDFFLHLGAIAGLYAVAIAFVSLLFTVINEAYPVIDQYSYYYSPSISLPMATLIIIFPVFLLLSRLAYGTYETDPAKKDLAIRRWLTYITLFVAGIILAGDLVTVLYKFLDGQDLTTAFLLKALVVLLLTGAVFKFYLDEIRDKITSGARRIWVIVVSIVIIIAIVLGFSVIGSPRTQRLIRYDSQKVADLQNIQWQIISIWQRKGVLPQTLAEMDDPISSYVTPNDPQTGEVYEYKLTGLTTFELCANFNLDLEASTANPNTRATMSIDPYSKTDHWDHASGRHCFSRTIDTALYSVIPVR